MGFHPGLTLSVAKQSKCSGAVRGPGALIARAITGPLIVTVVKRKASGTVRNEQPTTDSKRETKVAAAITIFEKDIISRQPAEAITPLTNGKPVEVSGVERVLIDPEKVLGGPGLDDWYRCKETGCNAAFETVAMTRAHRSKHSAKIAARRSARELEMIKAKKVEMHARRSQGVTAGHARSKARITEMRIRDPKVVINGVIARILVDVVAELRTLVRAMPDVPETPVIDITPEELQVLRTKAAKFDAIQAAFK